MSDVTFKEKPIDLNSKEMKLADLIQRSQIIAVNMKIEWC